MPTPYMTLSQIEPLFGFFVEKGLGDRHDNVRKAMRSAATAVVNEHGKVSGQCLPFTGIMYSYTDTSSSQITCPPFYPVKLLQCV